jgi:hypothetical protein
LGTEVTISIQSNKGKSFSSPTHPNSNTKREENISKKSIYNSKNFSDNSLEFSIHPNPNPGAFKIETNFPVSEVAHLKITNLLGTNVYEAQHLASNEIQLQNSGRGLYFVVMILKDGSVLTQKMMVQR